MIINAGELLDILSELTQTVRVEAETRHMRGAVVLEDLGVVCVRFVREAPGREVEQIQVRIDLRTVCALPNARAELGRHVGPLLAAIDGQLGADAGNRYPAGAWVQHVLGAASTCLRCGVHAPPALIAERLSPGLEHSDPAAWQREGEWRAQRPVAIAVPCFPAVPDHRRFIS